MNSIFKKTLLHSTIAFASISASQAEYEDKNLYKDLVAPILEAKCVSCHGEEKSKGKLRLDLIEHIMKGGSEGESVIPGKASDSPLIYRVVLPLDDDEHMPPEDKPQLTEAEFDVLTFWVKSGAKADATIGSLKPSEKEMAALVAAIKNPPKGGHSADPKKPAAPVIDDATKIAIAEAIGQVEKAGASLMAIAQDTPELRFSALNVQKEFDDKSLDLLKPAASHLKWVDVARTKVTDAGMAKIGSMKAITRLHLEGTGITDAGLEQLKGLENLEYLNVYNTKITDVGLQKLAGLKKLKKVFVWQTKVTDAGARKLAAAIPGVDVNTGWKADTSVKVAAVTPKKPEAKPTPAPPAPAKKATPTKPAPTKPTPTKPAPKAKPATPPAPAAKPLEGSIAKAIADADKTLAAAKQKAASARKSATDAVKAAEVAQKAAVAADNEAKKAQAALELLQKAAAALK